MSFLSIVFNGFEILAALAAICILFVKNVFHGALLLLVCLLCLAGIFVIANAEFVAVVQILIYAGGVLVLVLFGVMLTARIEGKPLRVKNQYVFAATVVSVLFSVMLIRLFSEAHFYQSTTYLSVSPYNSINQIGITLMSDYVLPLEVTAILLLVALLGAAVTAASFNTPKKF